MLHKVFYDNIRILVGLILLLGAVSNSVTKCYFCYDVLLFFTFPIFCKQIWPFFWVHLHTFLWFCLFMFQRFFLFDFLWRILCDRFLMGKVIQTTDGLLVEFFLFEILISIIFIGSWRINIEILYLHIDVNLLIFITVWRLQFFLARCSLVFPISRVPRRDNLSHLCLTRFFWSIGKSPFLCQLQILLAKIIWWWAN